MPCSNLPGLIITLYNGEKIWIIITLAIMSILYKIYNGEFFS